MVSNSPLPTCVRLLVVISAVAWVCWWVGAAPTVAQEAESPEESVAPTDGSGVASLFEDFIHFARLGRFDAAKAYATRLLDHPDLDPVELMTVAGRDANNIDTLIVLVEHSSIAEQAQQILDVIRRGEFMQRQDPKRIKDNIEKLLGPPQTEYNAIQRLAESGEYAVPWMVEALGDRNRERLWPRIVRALPQLGRDAIKPMVIALENDRPETVQTLARALGEAGYPQAIPYLQKLAGREGMAAEVRQAAVEAIEGIERRSGRRMVGTAADNFVDLAEQYYAEHGSVKADPRVPTANLWYLRDGFLTAVAVPTEIFGPIMTMRCCEEALLLAPRHQGAIALWLAANIRREARLGMDVESDQGDPNADKDPSRPEDFPRSVYFTRAAGPLYGHLVLERAVRDGDAEVALGAIAALRVTAGESSLVGTEDYKQPLVEALRFPDRLVRIKAALALAAALPKSPFAGSQFVPEVLAEAMSQGGSPRYVVVDADESNLNRVLGELRETQATVIGDTNFYTALARARKELDTVTCFFLGTDLENPTLVQALRHLKDEYVYANTPIVLLVKPEHVSVAETVARQVPRIEQVPAGSGVDELTQASGRAFEKSGQTPLGPEVALPLAMETADVIRQVALDGKTVIPVAAVEPALISALSSESEELRIKIASALALFPTATAQDAIARLALNTDHSESLRIAAFDALAESARTGANRLDPQRIADLIKVAADEPVLPLRTAASEALGALNLTTNQASEIIRKYHQG
jgi:HEAT repeat protein